MMVFLDDIKLYDRIRSETSYLTPERKQWLHNNLHCKHFKWQENPFFCRFLDEEEEEENLPTSPGLTKPALALRQGIEAAVFITLGASTMMIGDPTWSFGFGRGGSFAVSQHLTVTRGM